MKDPEQDDDRNRDHEHDPAIDNGGHEKSKGKLAPALKAGSALTSIEALGAALAKVDTSAFTGRTGLPNMIFKAREGQDGTWGYGQKRIEPEEGSRWAVNPNTFKWGWISFTENNKPVERMVPVTQPKPLLAELPNTGFEWHEQWSVQIKCVSDGADAGVEAVLKATTDGGLQAVVGLFDAVRDRATGGQHEGKIVAIVLLEKDSYPHSKHGRHCIPVLPFVEWTSFDGSAPAPAPAPEPTPPPKAPQATAAEQPRRRRVVVG
jgi:hypothetical protein